MLIAALIKKQQQKIADNSAQWQHQQKLLQAETWLLKQRAKQFLGSTPGLVLSFGAGVLMQMRHKSIVKTVRKTLGFAWFRQLIALI